MLKKIISYFKTRKERSLQKKILGLYTMREDNTSNDADLKKEIALNFKLAAFYKKRRFSKYFPNAFLLVQECYRAAASLGDAQAQYFVSQLLARQGRFWTERAQGIYSCNAYNKYADDFFQESFAYLKAAEAQGHPLAKRMHGMAYIHGWGVAVDEDHGFGLVVESIEQEGSWDKATKIFTELGLNKSDFFQSVMASRKR